MRHEDGYRARLDGVRLTYDGGATWALDGVTLGIHAGERVCVLGANGSGKSTLAQLLAGLEAPDEGTVELAGLLAYDGRSVDADAYRRARLRTGLVFQNPEDQIVTSVVEDDVAFGPENLGLSRGDIASRVEEELSRVALGNLAGADPARLSGGQQQRVAIAGALAMHPDLLVLDEPGAMLDVRGRRGIMRVLEKLQGAGVTLVHITHFMEEALEADRVIVLDHGHVALDGTPEDVFSQPGRMQQAGLDLPLVERVALELGLSPCSSAQALARELGPLAPQAARTSQATSSADVTKACARDTEPGTRAASHDLALSLSHVSFSYGDGPAGDDPVLADVSLGVGPGELVALAGHTGSGKSTIARLCCALALPDSGAVTACGVDTSEKDAMRRLRGRVGYVMQRPERQLFAPTVFEDVAYGPRNLGLPDSEVNARVHAQLEALGISEKAGCSPFELSGGQQRLAALAGVLAMEPDVLVLDEPVAGLDPHGARLLRNTIRSLRERGMAMLLVSHSMEDVAELADRIVVLGNGRIELEGTPTSVFSHEERLRDLGLGLPSPLALAHGLEDAGGIARGALDEPLTERALVSALARARGEARPC